MPWLWSGQAATREDSTHSWSAKAGDTAGNGAVPTRTGDSFGTSVEAPMLEIGQN